MGLFLVFLVFFTFNSYSWGFFGHQLIAKNAVFAIPSTQLAKFYKKNIVSLVNQAPNPDIRRYSDPNESPRHFIDIDHFGQHPFEIMPQKWNDAKVKFTEDTLKTYGIVPWQVQWTYYALVEAFKENNTQKIIKLSADLGHYVADAHVPLHTTENHNGQLSNQHGIHAFWESRLPEMFAEEYDFYVGKAVYIPSPLHEAWQVVKSSHLALDSVLRFEKMLQQQFSADRRFGLVKRGKKILQTYSNEYALAYHQQLSGMVEKRMQLAIFKIACFLYSAWIDAGQPDLNEEPLANPTTSFTSYPEGKMLGGRTEDE